MADFAGHDFIIVLFLRAETKLERVMGIEPTSLSYCLVAHPWTYRALRLREGSLYVMPDGS